MESRATMTALPDDIMDLLAAYALDALEPEEIARVNRLLEQQPELRQVVAELRAVANHLPYALPEATPGPDLRRRALDYATGRARRRDSRTPPRRLGFWQLAPAGLAVAALAASGIAWSQLNTTRTELERARMVLATTQARQQQIVAVMARPQVVAALTGASGHATVMHTPDGAALLAAQLPPLPPGRVYQLWLIQGANPPVSGGVFNVDQQGRGLLTIVPDQQLLSASTFAVTDEPAPGSPGPTSEILIAGERASS